MFNKRTSLESKACTPDISGTDFGFHRLTPRLCQEISGIDIPFFPHSGKRSEEKRSGSQDIREIFLKKYCTCSFLTTASILDLSSLLSPSRLSSFKVGFNIGKLPDEIRSISQCFCLQSKCDHLHCLFKITARTRHGERNDSNQV